MVAAFREEGREVIWGTLMFHMWLHFAWCYLYGNCVVIVRWMNFFRIVRKLTLFRLFSEVENLCLVCVVFKIYTLYIIWWLSGVFMVLLSYCCLPSFAIGILYFLYYVYGGVLICIKVHWDIFFITCIRYKNEQTLQYANSICSYSPVFNKTLAKIWLIFNE